MLYRDEVQPCCLNVEVKGESVVLQTAYSPWLVEQLETDRGLQVFSRLPEREHQRLLDIAHRPENVLSLAYTPSGVIIGQVTLAPVMATWHTCSKNGWLVLIFSLVSNTNERMQEHLRVDIHPAEADTDYPLSV